MLAAAKDEINSILYSFNGYHERIKFTVDYGDEFGVNFLDVKLMYDDGKHHIRLVQKTNKFG